MSGVDVRDHADAEPRYECDVEAELVVVGGGLAGLCLAVAAAREGCRTALVHNRPVLGGNSSSEVRVVPAGASHHSAWARETGLIEEILLADRASNHAQFWENGLTNSGYDLVLHGIAAAEPALTVLLNTHVNQVRLAGQRIVAVEAVQISTARLIRLRATQFADCTGDATLSRLAGADLDYGREARAEYDEIIAPATRDRVTAGSTLSIKARDVGRPVPFTAPAWAVPYRRPEDLGPFRVLRNVDRPEFGGFWWLEIGYPFHQITGTEEVRDTLLRHVMGVWDYIKNHHPDRDRFANYALEWVGSVVGKRESARVLGDVVLSERDCHTDRHWPDRVAGAGWYLDLHTGTGLLDVTKPGEPSLVDENYRAWVRVPPFTVPLRACYSRTVRNLWLGGRLLSSTRVANGALRVQQTLAQIGQATGVAAAYALAHGLTPRQAAQPGHVEHIRDRALYQDVRVPGSRLSIPDDLARAARITASSQAPLVLDEPDHDDGRALDRPWAQVFPVATRWIDDLAVHLRSTAPVPVELRWRLERVATLWQREDGVLVAGGRLRVGAHHHGWLTIPVRGEVRTGLHRLVLGAEQRVSWTAARQQPVATVAQFHHDSRAHPTSPWAELPEFAHWCQDKWLALSLRVTPRQYPYRAEDVRTGVAYPEDWTNQWASDPAQGLPQWIELAWDRPVRPTRLVLWFDTGLNTKLGLAPALWRAPECVRDYRVLGRAPGDTDWRVLATVRDNVQRVNRLDLPEVTVAALRVEVTATNEEELTEQRREQLSYWQRDGARELRASTPRGARIYQLVLHGAPG